MWRRADRGGQHDVRCYAATIRERERLAKSRERESASARGAVQARTNKEDGANTRTRTATYGRNTSPLSDLTAQRSARSDVHKFGRTAIRNMANLILARENIPSIKLTVSKICGCERAANSLPDSASVRVLALARHGGQPQQPFGTLRYENRPRVRCRTDMHRRTP